MGKAQLAAVWNAVRRDAKLEDAGVMLLGLPGTPPIWDAPAAKWFFPGDELVEEYEFPLDRRQLEAANRPTSRDRHRIAAWLGVEEVPLAAKLRHELEGRRAFRVV